MRPQRTRRNRRPKTSAEIPMTVAETTTLVFCIDGARIISAAALNSLRAFDLGYGSSGTGQSKNEQISSKPKPFSRSRTRSRSGGTRALTVSSLQERKRNCQLKEEEEEEKARLPLRSGERKKEKEKKNSLRQKILLKYCPKSCLARLYAIRPSANHDAKHTFQLPGEGIKVPRQ